MKTLKQQQAELKALAVKTKPAKPAPKAVPRASGWDDFDDAEGMGECIGKISK